MKSATYGLLSIALAISLAGCGERKPTPQKSTEATSSTSNAEAAAKEETIKIGKKWIFDLAKDEMTDKPKGHAYIHANESDMSFAVKCDDNELSYVIVTGSRHVFTISEVMQKSIHASFRAGDKKMMEGNFPIGTNQEAFFIDGDKAQFRAYLGDEKKLIARMNLMMPAGTHTFTFDISKLGEAESKLKAHCGIK